MLEITAKERCETDETLAVMEAYSSFPQSNRAAVIAFMQGLQTQDALYEDKKEAAV